MNDENLIPMSQRSPSEVRTMAANGGRKSGESRRARKTLKEELLLLLSEGDTQKSVSVALLKKAMDGDVRAFEVLRDSIGEKPTEKIMIADVDQSVINEVENMVNGNDEETSG